MNKTIHVSPGAIRRNRKCGKGEEPTIIVWEDDKPPVFVKEAIIYGQDGLEAARVVFSLEGLRDKTNTNVWIETKNKIGYTK